MKEKLDEIILLTSRIYDLYVSFIECELSDNKNEAKLNDLKEYLVIALDVEKSFYDKIFLNKEEFIKIINILNIENNSKLLFPYHGINGTKFVKTNLPLEIEYIYNFLFYNENEKLGKNLNYEEIIAKTSAHPIIKRIIFNLFLTFYKSKYYESFVNNDYLQYLNFDYISEIGNIIISRDNHKFMEELFMEASTEFTIRFLNNLRDKISKKDKDLYIYSKYTLAFTNRKIEKRLLEENAFGVDKIINIKEKNYNNGTSSIYNYYISRIAEDSLDEMLSHVFYDNISRNAQNFIFNMTESTFEEAFNYFNDDIKKEYMEDLEEVKKEINKEEYINFVNKLSKKKEYVYKKWYNGREGESNV